MRPPGCALGFGPGAVQHLLGRAQQRAAGVHGAGLCLGRTAAAEEGARGAGDGGLARAEILQHALCQLGLGDAAGQQLDAGQRRLPRGHQQHGDGRGQQLAQAADGHIRKAGAADDEGHGCALAQHLGAADGGHGAQAITAQRLGDLFRVAGVCKGCGHEHALAVLSLRPLSTCQGTPPAPSARRGCSIRAIRNALRPRIFRRCGCPAPRRPWGRPPSAPRPGLGLWAGP